MNQEKFIETLLVQANEHLRETDRKKNQTYYFFLVLVGFYFSTYGRLDKNLLIVITVIISIVGTILTLVILNFQIWHSIYVNTAIVLQKIWYRNLDLRSLDIQTISALFQENVKKYPFQGHGTEFNIYNSFLIITSSLWDLAIYNAITLITHKCSLNIWRIAIMIAFPLFYMYCFNNLRKKKLTEAENLFLEKSWILKFF